MSAECVSVLQPDKLYRLRLITWSLIPSEPSQHPILEVARMQLGASNSLGMGHSRFFIGRCQPASVIQLETALRLSVDEFRDSLPGLLDCLDHLGLLSYFVIPYIELLTEASDEDD